MSPAYGLCRIYQEMSAIGIARAVYGADADDHYIREKADAIRRDFMRWITSLDSTRMLTLDKLIASASADTLLPR